MDKTTALMLVANESSFVRVLMAEWIDDTLRIDNYLLNAELNITKDLNSFDNEFGHK